MKAADEEATMPRRQRICTGVVILTRTKEELKEALEVLTGTAEIAPHPKAPPRSPPLRLATPGERVA